MELKLTPSQQKILNLLSDGYGHTKEELSRCVGDEFTCWNNVLMHISNLRIALEKRRYTIVCINRTKESRWWLARLSVSYKEE